MSVLPYVLRAEYRGGYRIHLAFHDGREKTVDFTPWLRGPVFEPLKDPAYFRQVGIDEFGAVCWPNGADLAPDALHSKLRSQTTAAAGNTG